MCVSYYYVNSFLSEQYYIQEDAFNKVYAYLFILG